jgi:hypothetical protein
MHLVVRDEERIDLYDATWMPHEIQTLELTEDRIHFRAMILGSAQTFVLEATRSDNEISGSLTLKYPQYVIRDELSGVRVSDQPFPDPVEWIARHRKEGVIDIAGYIARKAPSKSFEEFQRFWEDDLEPNFYIFLPRSDPAWVDRARSKQPTQLESLFNSLENLSEKCVQNIVKERQANPAGREHGNATDSNSPAGPSGGDRFDCVVLLPAAIGERRTLALSSIKNKYPPGVRPCCGESLYELEDFLLLPISCSEDSKTVSSESAPEKSDQRKPDPEEASGTEPPEVSPP